MGVGGARRVFGAVAFSLATCLVALVCLHSSHSGPPPWLPFYSNFAGGKGDGRGEFRIANQTWFYVHPARPVSVPETKTGFTDANLLTLTAYFMVLGECVFL